MTDAPERDAQTYYVSRGVRIIDYKHDRSMIS